MYDKDQYSFHTLKNFILRKEKERVLKQLQKYLLGSVLQNECCCGHDLYV